MPDIMTPWLCFMGVVLASAVLAIVTLIISDVED